MNQNCCFAEEMEEELRYVDIITEMHDAEGQRATARENERVEVEEARDALEMQMSVQELLDDVLLRETQLTSVSMHQNFQQEFIRRFNNESSPSTGEEQA